MGRKSGRTTSRKVLANHKGFAIIRVKVTEWYKPSYSQYYTNIPNKVETYYEFCKEGDEKKPSQAYNACARNIEECKQCIDNFIKDDCLYFTEAERNKYIYKPNHDNGWGFTRQMLEKLISDWKKADKRIKVLYCDRLEDANFHTLCGYLSDGDLDKCYNWINREFPFRKTYELSISHPMFDINKFKWIEDCIKNTIRECLCEEVGDTNFNITLEEKAY